MASSLRIKQVSPEELFIHKLPFLTRRAFLFCTKLPLLNRSQWYLAGGTALALQEGHRQSVDLDFFIPKHEFHETNLERLLSATEVWRTTLRQEGTLYGTLMDAKVSFIAYPFFLPSSWRIGCGVLKMLLPADIAAMKIVAISQRGRKRDFVDLYWYCTQHESLGEVVRHAVKQYPGQERNISYILKSLTYFVDAEKDPMPNIFFKATWRGIKQFFESDAKRIAKQLFIA